MEPIPASTKGQKNRYLNMVCVILMIKNNHKVIFIPKCTTQWFEVHYLFIYILFHVLVWFVMWVPIKSVRWKCSFIAAAQPFQWTFLKEVPGLWPPITKPHRWASMYDEMVGVHEICLAAISYNFTNHISKYLERKNQISNQFQHKELNWTCIRIERSNSVSIST